MVSLMKPATGAKTKWEMTQALATQLPSSTLIERLKPRSKGGIGELSVRLKTSGCSRRRLCRRLDEETLAPWSSATRFIRKALRSWIGRPSPFSSFDLPLMLGSPAGWWSLLWQGLSHLRSYTTCEPSTVGAAPRPLSVSFQFRASGKECEFHSDFHSQAGWTSRTPLALGGILTFE